MADGLRPTALAVFAALFGVIALAGFAAAWRGPTDTHGIEEWALAGRRFGTLISWFLIGGDLYTAYTMIAVPALVWGAGAMGFFALPYTVLIYPLVFLIMPRLWAVSRRRGYVTPADFVLGRYGHRGLAAAIALAGIVATIPYIALQLVGIQTVLGAMGIAGGGMGTDLPLVAAFLILAAYDWYCGLRAPAFVALAKDSMIFVMVVSVVTVLPARLGGYGHIFGAAAIGLASRHAHLILPPSAYSAYATLALGSAFALMMYPHSITGILSARSARVIRRNAALLPIYSLFLGLIALMGYMAITARISPASPSRAVPDLLLATMPEWFAGFCFATIAIGAMVPASIMSIAAANLFTRNLWLPMRGSAASPRRETAVAKSVAILIKLGALGFVIMAPMDYAINLQLLGGIWILQNFPAVVFGLYGRWFDARALLLGWCCGMATGTAMALAHHLASPIHAVTISGVTVSAYIAIWALLANIAVATVLTAAIGQRACGPDETHPEDYLDETPTAAPSAAD